MAIWGLTKEDALKVEAKLDAEGFFDRFLKRAYPNGVPKRFLNSKKRKD